MLYQYALRLSLHTRQVLLDMELNSPWNVNSLRIKSNDYCKAWYEIFQEVVSNCSARGRTESDLSASEVSSNCTSPIDNLLEVSISASYLTNQAFLAFEILVNSWTHSYSTCFPAYTQSPNSSKAKESA